MTISDVCATANTPKAFEPDFEFIEPLGIQESRTPQRRIIQISRLVGGPESVLGVSPGESRARQRTA